MLDNHHRRPSDNANLVAFAGAVGATGIAGVALFFVFSTTELVHTPPHAPFVRAETAPPVPAFSAAAHAQRVAAAAPSEQSRGKVTSASRARVRKMVAAAGLLANIRSHLVFRPGRAAVPLDIGEPVASPPAPSLRARRSARRPTLPAHGVRDSAEVGLVFARAPVDAEERDDGKRVRATLAQHRAALQGCYEQGLKRDAGKAGTVVAELSIGASGRVHDVRVNDRASLGSGVSRCIAAVLKRAAFEPLQENGELTVQINLVFKPGSGMKLATNHLYQNQNGSFPSSSVSPTERVLLSSAR